MSIYSLSNEQRGMCRNGHPWEGENIMTTKGGGKRCRACVRATAKRYRDQEDAYGQRVPLYKVEEHKKEGTEPRTIPKLLKRRRSRFQPPYTTATRDE